MLLDCDYIQNLFSSYGFSEIAFVSAKTLPDQEMRYQKWLQRGHHAKMEFLVKHSKGKFNPCWIMPECKSIWFLILPYYQNFSKTHQKGVVARYAWGRDYHKIFRNLWKKVEPKLNLKYPNEKFRFFSDATPLSERYYAFQAGLGFIGKNNLLIHPKYGSWFFLAEVFSSLEYDGQNNILENECGNCQKCVESCPTHALEKEYDLNCTRCISYLTIENREEIPKELQQKIKYQIFGCDLCQECCPYNQNIPPTTHPDLLQHIAGEILNISEIINMSEQTFQKKYAGSPILRAKYSGIVRNAQCLLNYN